MKPGKNLRLFIAIMMLASGIGCVEPDVTSLDFLTRVASEINTNVPMMVDSETEMYNVSAAEATLIYNYRLVNLGVSEIDGDTLVEQLKPQVTKTVCSTPDTRETFLDKGVTLRYVYYDKDRTHIVSFDVAPKDCGFTS